MKFDEVLKHLVAGDYVSRPEWDDKGEYIVVMPGMQYIWKILTIPNPNAGNWIPTLGDMFAEDWKVNSKCNTEHEEKPSEDKNQENPSQYKSLLG